MARQRSWRIQSVQNAGMSTNDWKRRVGARVPRPTARRAGRRSIRGAGGGRIAKGSRGSARRTSAIPACPARARRA